MRIHARIHQTGSMVSLNAHFLVFLFYSFFYYFFIYFFFIKMLYVVSRRYHWFVMVIFGLFPSQRTFRGNHVYMEALVDRYGVLSSFIL